MRIDYNVHLDYSDVLLKPKRSTLSSRRDVDIYREFHFRNANKSLRYTPIMASNMDGVGTFAMAKVLQEFKMMTVIRKHYTFDEWKTAVSTGLRLKYVSACTGTGAMWDENAPDYQTLKQVMTAFPDIPFITIDVANAYHEQFVDFVKRIRSEYPDKVIIAGNVVSPEMTEELIINGADIVKIGIGPGCFAPGQKVKTDKGLKNIEDIKKGEKVLTHTGSYKTVTNTFKFNDKKSIVNINGIKATPNHEFYVLHKQYQEIVTEDNIQQYAEWVEAKDLTKEYLLLKHK